ncbi:MAG: flavin reductase family protein [Ruminococcaceae bacterium]|nr:flavin reductase family protein [Oscillospiraceae bacterium]
MKEIKPYDITDNLFTAVNHDWMLITAMNRDGKVNTMTASWGGFGILWGKPVCVCVIRPQRYTHQFTEEADRLTLTFLKEGHREALNLCGTVSGRDGNKIEKAGLHTVIDGEYAYFEESRLVICGRKIYVSQIKEENFLDPAIVASKYPQKDFHTVYVCEIESVRTAD